MIETYTGGYLKALLDVRSFFEGHSETLKFNRLYNQKGVMQLLDALIENRDELRTTGDVKLRYNPKTKEIVHAQGPLKTKRSRKGGSEDEAKVSTR